MRVQVSEEEQATLIIEWRDHESEPENYFFTLRTASRPKRHFPDSFITVRLAIARIISTWLPRCPICHRINTTKMRAKKLRKKG